jgi:hypothetical protein
MQKISNCGKKSEREREREREGAMFIRCTLSDSWSFLLGISILNEIVTKL